MDYLGDAPTCAFCNHRRTRTIDRAKGWSEEYCALTLEGRKVTTSMGREVWCPLAPIGVPARRRDDHTLRNFGLRTMIQEGYEVLESMTFYVLGLPIAEGSLTAIYIPKLKRTIQKYQNDKELKAWRERVSTMCHEALLKQSFEVTDKDAYSVSVLFVFARPPSVKDTERLLPIIKPDTDKLQRAIGDALTTVLFKDDCQIVQWLAMKDYDTNCDLSPGAYVTVARVTSKVGQERMEAKIAAKNSRSKKSEAQKDFDRMRWKK